MNRPVIAQLTVALVIFQVCGTAGQKPRFASSTDIVPVYASVRASDGEIVRALDEKDFELRVDGRVTEVALFSRERHDLSVAIVFDRSRSNLSAWNWSLAAAAAFVDALLPTDRASLRSLNGMVASLTADKERLRSALGSVGPDSGSPIWRVLTEAVESLRHAHGRRVVLVFTDGEDADMSPPPRELSLAAQNSGVTLYTAYTYSPVSFGISAEQFARTAASGSNSANLAVFVESTGGRGIRIRIARDRTPVSDVPAIFAGLADELRFAYLLGLVPSLLDGKSHRLAVRVKRSGVSVLSRGAYVASR